MDAEPSPPEPIEAQDFEAQAQPAKEITIFLLGILLRTRDSHLRKGMFMLFVVGLRSVRLSYAEKVKNIIYFGLY